MGHPWIEVMPVTRTRQEDGMCISFGRFMGCEQKGNCTENAVLVQEGYWVLPGHNLRFVKKESDYAFI
jgi:hypothetical protein